MTKSGRQVRILPARFFCFYERIHRIVRAAVLADTFAFVRDNPKNFGRKTLLAAAPNWCVVSCKFVRRIHFAKRGKNRADVRRINNETLGRPVWMDFARTAFERWFDFGVFTGSRRNTAKRFRTFRLRRRFQARTACSWKTENDFHVAARNHSSRRTFSRSRFCRLQNVFRRKAAGIIKIAIWTFEW